MNDFDELYQLTHNKRLYITDHRMNDLDEVSELTHNAQWARMGNRGGGQVGPIHTI